MSDTQPLLHASESDGERLIKCGRCGTLTTANECDCMGTCHPDNVFCPECQGEIDSVTGAPVAACGKCQWCMEVSDES